MKNQAIVKVKKTKWPDRKIQADDRKKNIDRKSIRYLKWEETT